jgi:hypothetical protein
VLRTADATRWLTLDLVNCTKHNKIQLTVKPVAYSLRITAEFTVIDIILLLSNVERQAPSRTEAVDCNQTRTGERLLIKVAAQE